MNLERELKGRNRSRVGGGGADSWTDTTHNGAVAVRRISGNWNQGKIMSELALRQVLFEEQINGWDK